MNLKILLIIFLLLAFIFDGSFVSLPIVFILCVLLYVLEPKSLTVALIFFAGIILDMLRLTPIGSTSLFLLATCALIYLYRNTLELKEMQFIILPPFVFAYIYASLFHYNTNILIYLVLFGISEAAVYYFGRNKISTNISMIHNSWFMTQIHYGKNKNWSCVPW